MARIDRDPQIDAYLAGLAPGSLPVGKDLQHHLGLRTWGRTQQVYADYRDRHQTAPEFEGTLQSRRGRRDEKDRMFINARTAGMSLDQIAADGQLGSHGSVAKRSGRLTSQGKTPRFKALSPKAHQMRERAKELEAQGIKQGEIARDLGIHRVHVNRLLRHGPRRAPKPTS